jgi:hypothetical protein
MASNPNAPATPPVADIPHAPFLFFDNVPAYGHANGVFNLTLSAMRAWATKDGSLVQDLVVVAYLRSNAEALISLRQAIDGALAFAASAAQKPAN